MAFAIADSLKVRVSAVLGLGRSITPPLDHSTLAISARSAIGGVTLAQPASRPPGN